MQWMQRYNLDKDLTLVENSLFGATEDDIFPVMSMCFRQTFEDDVFSMFEGEMSGKAYETYLHGKHFDENMTKIDYHGITTNILDHVIFYTVIYANQSAVNVASSPSFKQPYYTYSFNKMENIYKCFGLEITDPTVEAVKIHMNSDIFGNSSSDSNGGITFLFHYPNQVVWSFRTFKPPVNAGQSMSKLRMYVNVRAMEVHRYRYKERVDNCEQDWRNFDRIVLQNHINTVGCKSPYYNDEMYNGTSCKKEEWNKKASFDFVRVRNVRPPCRSIESIDYIVDQMNSNKNLTWQGKPYTDWFDIGLAIRNSQFKAIIQTKEIDFQCLIGYVGGYIGMFTGFALAQIPDILIVFFGFVKKLFKNY